MINGSIDNETPAALAEEFAELVRRAGPDLDFSPESLQVADEVMDQLVGAGLANDEERLRMTSLIGSYYGEVIRRNLGGDWYFGLGETGDCGLVLDAETENVVWCYATVAKEVFGGTDKNLWSLYQVIAQMRRQVLS
jgi:hypothetical protein